MNIRKLCPRCRRSLTLSSFHKNSKSPDRHCQLCKSCACKKTREHRDANLAYFRKYDRERAKTRERKDQGLEKVRQQRSRLLWRRAHEVVARAVRAGDLVREPCEVCGAARVEGHHDDYRKPLIVRWLCSKHHNEHHAAIARAEAERRDEKRVRSGGAA